MMTSDSGQGAESASEPLDLSQHLAWLNKGAAERLIDQALKGVWGDEVAAVFARVVPQVPDLKTLDVGYMSLTPFAIKTICSNLMHLPQLIKFSISDNRLEVEGAAAVSHGLRYLPHLAVLNLNATRIHADGAVMIASGLEYVPQLRELTIAYSYIGDVGVMALAEVISKGCLSQLTRLDLAANGITAAGAIALARSLPSTPLLSVLDIGWNHEIGSNGVMALVTALPQLQHVSSLNLPNTFRGSHGDAALMAALALLPCLESLNLDQNDLRDKGVAALVAKLPSIRCLTVLSLRLNLFNIYGAVLLSRVLARMPMLQLIVNSAYHNIDDYRLRLNLKLLEFLACLSNKDDWATRLGEYWDQLARVSTPSCIFTE
jgi:Ran GTPase-activating protein (RanGAP) involved in mRNA processing and transport